MSKVISVSSSIRLVLLSLILAAMMTLGWAAVAQAQAPFGAQYGPPERGGVVAIVAADVDGGGGAAGGGGGVAGLTASGGGAVSGGGGVAGLTASDGGAGPTSGVVGLSALPDTAGALLPFVALGIFALSSAALLAVRLGWRNR